MNSSRPYLLRAIHEWLVDNQKTPHIMVNAEMVGVDVPSQFIKDGKIVLNVAPEATGDLRLGKKLVTFHAGFGSEEHFISVPIPAVEAIYAFENGRGMYFSEEDLGDEVDESAQDATSPDGDGGSGSADSGKKGGSHLKIVK